MLDPKYYLDKIRSEQGFTLTELLVVILIIGILLAIAIPMFQKQRAKANDASVQADMHNLTIATNSVTNTDWDYAPEDAFDEQPLSKGVETHFEWTGDHTYCIAAWHEAGGKLVEDDPLVYDNETGVKGVMSSLPASSECSYMYLPGDDDWDDDDPDADGDEVLAFIDYSFETTTRMNYDDKSVTVRFVRVDNNNHDNEPGLPIATPFTIEMNNAQNALEVLGTKEITVTEDGIPGASVTFPLPTGSDNAHGIAFIVQSIGEGSGEHNGRNWGVMMPYVDIISDHFLDDEDYILTWDEVWASQG